MNRIVTALLMFTVCMLPSTLMARHYYYHHRTHVKEPKTIVFSRDTLNALDKWPSIYASYPYPNMSGSVLLDNFSGRFPVTCEFSTGNPTVQLCHVVVIWSNARLVKADRELH